MASRNRLWATVTFLALTVAVTAEENVSVTGWVSDESCGALHTKPGGEDCIRKCIKGAVHLNPQWTAQRMVLVVDPAEEIWYVTKPETLKGYEGKHIRVLGKLDRETMEVEVLESSVLDDEKKGATVLGDSDFIAFVATAQAEKAREFYVDTLGLELVADEPQALVLRGNGRLLRIQKVSDVPRPVGTVFGWRVEDIAGKVRELSDNGVTFEQYEGLPQDKLGIATFPNRDKVAWFLDPDGNILSLSELAAAAGAPSATRSGAPFGEVAASPRLYRVIMPAGDIEASVRFYRRLLDTEGERVSAGRHYFTCGGVILAVVDPRADRDDRDAHSNSDHVYLSVDALEPYHERAEALQALSPVMGTIETRPWGERSFYLKDPFGNPLSFVDESTLFLGHAYRP